MVQKNQRLTCEVTILSKIRSVIIGCGAIFPMHAVSVMNSEKAELIAVCDIKEEVAKKRAEECGCAYYTDYKVMIDEIKPDAVHICLPHYLHAPVSIYALEHGCNVMCEKPMATTVEDAEAMLAGAKKSGKTLEIIFQNRYNNASRLIHDTIQSGKLGKVIGGKASVCWYRSDEYYSESDWRGIISTEGGSVCVNQAIHTLDLLLWFVSKKPTKVCANIATLMHEIETEDTASGVISFEDGINANFWFTNNNYTDEPVSVTIDCENGTAKLTGTNAVITFKNGEELTAQNTPGDFIEYGNVKNYWGVSHTKQIGDFYHHIITGEKMHLDCYDAFETHKIMCAILESGRTNKEVKIN